MNSYRFAPLAVKDLTAVCDFIAVENPRAASQLFDSIRKKCRLVAQFPKSGKRYERLMKGLWLGIILFFICRRRMGLKFCGW
jgi:toxin ParE1/3/4